MINKTAILILTIFILCIFLHSNAQALERKSKETLIEKIDLSSWVPESFTVSANGKHYAYVFKKDGKEQAVIDGSKGKEYDLILKGPGGYFTFSPDIDRVIYFAQLDGKQFSVTDGKEGSRYDKAFTEEDSITFSPDSRKTAYIAGKDGNQFVVTDGVEGKKYKGNISVIAFSPDSSRMFYKVKEENKEFVVLDGKEETRFDEVNDHNPPLFSPDSKRFAYHARKVRKWVAVIDGKEGPEHDFIFFGGPVFSPDSKRVVYAAMRDSGPFLGNDDITDWNAFMNRLKEHKSPIEERIWSLMNDEAKQAVESWKSGEAVDEKTVKIVLYGLNNILDVKDFYSKDLFKSLKMDWANTFLLNNQLSKLKNNVQLRKFNRFLLELVYPREIVRSRKFHTVLDGKDGKEYDLIFTGNHGGNFSADSREFMYLARCDDKWFIVKNGKEGKKYDYAQNQYATFTPDGKQIAYFAGTGKDRFMVFGEKEGKKFDDIVVPPLFTRDGKRMTYAALSGDKAVVVTDGQEGAKYDMVREYIFSTGKDGRKRMLTLAEALGKPVKYIVNCNIRRKMIYEELLYIVNRFSPDGKRSAYTAQKDGKWFVVTDGKEGEKYDDIITAPIFSPDGGLAVYPAKSKGRELVVVEGNEGEKYDQVFLNEGNVSIFFRGADTFQYIARKGSDIFLVEEKVK